MTRRATVAKVQIARKELGLDEDTYRSILERLTGHRSAADASDDQLKVVLQEFKAKGWKPKVLAGGRAQSETVRAATAGSAPRSAADHPSAKKARALWLSLWNLGEVEDPSEAALEAMARRQLKVERLQWADQGLTYKLIEALKAWAERAGWSQDLAGVEKWQHVRTLKERLLVAIDRKLVAVGQYRERTMWSMSDRVLDAEIADAGETLRKLTEAAR